MAWLLRFSTWVIERYCPSSINSRTQGCLEMGPLPSVEEVKYTEREVIKHVQRLFFPDVIKVAQNTQFPALSKTQILMGHNYHSLLPDATIMYQNIAQSLMNTLVLFL